MGCAQVLGIPSDPALVEEAVVPPVAAPAPASIGAPPEQPSGTSAGPSNEPGADPGLSLGNGGQADPASAEALRPDAGLAGVPPSPGLVDAGAAELPPGAECGAGLARQPVDVVFIVDNSGSMGAMTAEVERTLPAFAQRLDGDGLDYRIILISRHRNDDRAASSEASTSVCIAAPLGGLAECPSLRPALGPRFFQYSIKIDASDSFQRVLEASAEPDPFGLTEVGWVEWLRLGAQTVFIEITDADSALSSAAFVRGLAAAAPDHFGVDPSDPGFTFHSIVGVTETSLVPDVYRPDEPIQIRVCTGAGANPDNAGEIYQALSRSTSGLRQSICPAAALGVRLQVLAADVLQRSACVSP
jgi:hypothetical protein